MAKRGRRTSDERNSACNGVSRHIWQKYSNVWLNRDLLRQCAGQGGFVLAKPAEQITLYDIYKVVEGELAQQYCLLTKDYCPFGECLLGGVVQTLTENSAHICEVRR